mmetsp:Transcript_15951/g.20438  ORF Transcript_15951/g.20438 Transcript_15951/m.20438 type:complete len:87 (-) Transcript_15951:6-266(-)
MSSFHQQCLFLTFWYVKSAPPQHTNPPFYPAGRDSSSMSSRGLLMIQYVTSFLKHNIKFTVNFDWRLNPNLLQEEMVSSDVKSCPF